MSHLNAYLHASFDDLTVGTDGHTCYLLAGPLTLFLELDGVCNRTTTLMALARWVELVEALVDDEVDR